MLKKLELIYCCSAINFDELAENLLKPMQNRMLDELKVSSYNVTDSACTTHFCDTIFGMPQLQHLSLDLNLNYYPKFTEMLETMYESWKKNSKGIKPKQLMLRFLDVLDLEEKWRTMQYEMGVAIVCARDFRS